MTLHLQTTRAFSLLCPSSQTGLPPTKMFPSWPPDPPTSLTSRNDVISYFEVLIFSTWYTAVSIPRRLPWKFLAVIFSTNMVSGTLVVSVTVSLFVSARPAARAETVVRAGSNTDSCEGKQISFTTFKDVYTFQFTSVRWCSSGCGWSCCRGRGFGSVKYIRAWKWILHFSLS